MTDKETENVYKRQTNPSTERKKKRKKKKKRHPVLVFLIILAVLVLAAVFGFQTKEIQITGNERVTDNEVKELIQSDKSHGNTLIL